jgi:hypothetical protein
MRHFGCPGAELVDYCIAPLVQESEEVTLRHLEYWSEVGLFLVVVAIASRTGRLERLSHTSSCNVCHNVVRSLVDLHLSGPPQLRGLPYSDNVVHGDG